MKSSLRVALEALVERARDAERSTMTDAGWNLFGDERSASPRASALAAVVRTGRHHGVAGIARVLGVYPHYATEIVKDLEAHGLVHRVVREGGSKHAILLTQEGAEALAEAEEHDDKVLGVVLGDLSEEERASFIAIMEKLAMGESEPEPEVEEASG